MVLMICILRRDGGGVHHPPGMTPALIAPSPSGWVIAAEPVPAG